MTMDTGIVWLLVAVVIIALFVAPKQK